MKADAAAKQPMDMATAMPNFSAGLVCKALRMYHGMMANMRSMMPE